MISEDVSGGAGGGGIGVSAEPPGFLKRLFSVPKNVRRTAAAGDVVVPVIGARDGWGGIRQARFRKPHTIPALERVTSQRTYLLLLVTSRCNLLLPCVRLRRFV